MPYLDLINHLLKVNLENGMKLGLQNVERLQQLTCFPDRSFSSIHVTGTNGKGSVCIKTASALEHAGYRVALYTSPHISCFRERIRVNGEMISERAIEEILPRLFKIVEEHNIPATFFEITTFLALLYFAEEKVDFAILETGLGGRLDATNIVTPCLSLITSISLDHTEILGSSIDEIAFEKGGIIKKEVPVIIGPQVPLNIIQKIADEKNCHCQQVQETSLIFETQNRLIAKAALNHLSTRFPIPKEAIERGLTACQPCRFEVVEGQPMTVLDVGHNPDGIQHLFQTVKHHFPNQPLRLLFGLSKSKDIQGCLKLIAKQGVHFHLVEATNGRGATKESLHEGLLKLGIHSSAISLQQSIAEGVQKAREEALRHDEVVVIFGTFFIMGEVRQALNYQEPADIFDMNERNQK